MCGIAGIVDPSGGVIDEGVLRRMTAAVASRGPDGEGFWSAPGVGLGHRRLKVIDLSDAAAQPMAGRDASVQVVFNGEIYNFASLRDELEGTGHRFRTRSDTEVIVRGYEEWGDAVVQRLEGMFAFALWDARGRRLLAARDRMGKKPFYYAQIPRAGLPPLFVFGSELKALFPVPGMDRDIDSTALSRYLVYECVPPPFTIVRGAHKLDSAERLVLDVGTKPTGAPVVERYWDLPFPDEHRRLRDDEAAEELLMLLRRAVKRRLVSDVPLGVFLSGGIDSSAVTALMAAEVGAARVKSFSIGFSDPSFDESAHARAVARRLGTDHLEDQLTPMGLLEILPEVTSFLDEPLADASIVPTYLLSRFTRQHVTVALGGDGGDELFAGYPTFVADRIARTVLDHIPRQARVGLQHAASFMPARTEYFSLDFKLNQFLRGGDDPGPRRHQRWLASFLPEELPSLLTPDSLRSSGGDPLAEIDDRVRLTRARDPMDQVMDFYCRFYLGRDVNVKVDRASGACGLEVRAPFLDTDLVTFACSLPPGMRMRGLTSKYLLKRAMRGILPSEIIHRRKQGFGVPVARWLKEDLQDVLRVELHPDKLRREGHFQPSAVSRLVEEHVAGRRDHRKRLWTLFMFERWLATWGGEAS